MTPTVIEDAYPLTPLQQGMLFNYLLTGSGSADVMQVVCSLEHDLDVAAFRRAWSDLISRHPVLRTAFRWEGLAEPIQEVLQDAELDFSRLDWSDAPGATLQGRLEQFLELDLDRGFDLSSAPLMRVTLIKLGRTAWKCIWTRHHIILDGNSYPVVFTDLLELYESLRTGRPPRLSEVRPFREHVEWLGLRDWGGSERFWRERLSGFSAPNQLPPPIPGGGQSAGQGHIELRLSGEETAALKRFAVEHRVTVNAVFVGAWALLLSRYTGDDDVVFGTTRACRMSPEYDASSTVGLLINTLPFRTRVPADRPVVAWLKGILEEWMRIAEHEHTPLPLVTSWAASTESRSLFDTFVVFNARSLTEVLQAKGGDWARRDFIIRGQASFPLGVAAYLGKELRIRMTYDRSRVDGGTAQRMLGQLRAIINRFVANPNRSPTELDILTESESQHMVVEWNATQVDFGSMDTVSRLVERQVDRNPDATALVLANERVSYGELDARANRLAHYLERQGVRPGMMIGILLRHSVELVVATLGVMKAGGACLLLEPETPRNRLTFMLEDSGVWMVVTDPSSSGNVDPANRRVMCLETSADEIASQSDGRLDLPLSGEGPAYAVYTSGSTGQPKAVLNSHRGLCNVLLGMWHGFELSSDDVMLLKTPLSFDAVYTEMLRSLVGGARLVVAEHERRHDLEYLTELMSDHRVTFVSFVPSILRRWLQEPDVTALLPVRLVVSLGESLSWDVADALRERLDARLFNEYGPAEAAVVFSVFEVGEARPGSSVPIGRPLPNNCGYIVDRYFKLAPIGVPGELCIGGIQVGLGYLHRPDLTAERFVADLFSDDPTARLYRTGDVARYLPDGNIEFLGRVDNQIKIRGVRIELEEVEFRVREHSAVEDAAATTFRLADGDLAAAVYFTVKNGVHVPSDEIRLLLRQSLPTSMMPTLIERVDALPRTNNQKIDRARLPVPDTRAIPESHSGRSPRNELEAQVLGIWSEVLGRELADVDQDFFAMGGHSILATKIINQLNSEMGAVISLPEFFDSPTAAGVAERLSTQTWEL